MIAFFYFFLYLCSFFLFIFCDSYTLLYLLNFFLIFLLRNQVFFSQLIKF
nr:MAG TPA: hypothetical protein [Caudoviricetes sp.]